MKRNYGLIAAVLMAGGSACNLSDLTRVNFLLPVRTVTLDTMTKDLGLPPNLPSVACSVDADCCGGGTCPASPVVIRCETGVCSATAPFTLIETVDLSTVPNLATVTSLANVTLRSIQYAVCQNTLTLPIPTLDLWLGPQSSTAADPTQGAKKVGTVAMIPAGTDRSCPASSTPDPRSFAQVTLEPDAPATFASFAQNVKTPFHVMAVGTVKLRGGDPTPMGAVTLLISGDVEASLK